MFLCMLCMQVMIQAEDGRMLERRDPYARQADVEGAWCYADDPTR